MTRLIAVWMWGLIVSLTLLSVALAVPLWLLVPRRLDPTGRRFDAVAWLVWGRLPFWLNPFWRMDFQGLENLAGGGPFLLVPNHQSMVDVLAVLGLPVRMKWVTHARFLKTPVLGLFMRLAGYVPIDALDLASARKMIRSAEDIVMNGISVALFPEGTRSSTGEPGPFLAGPFRIALDTRIPIVPVLIEGTREALPKGSWLPLGAAPWTLRVRLLHPIEPAEFRSMTAIGLARLVEARVRSARNGQPVWQAPARASDGG